MPRRSFLALLLSSSTAIAETPRNELCSSANTFHEPYGLWAEKMNAAKDKPHTIPADAIEAFHPLPDLWRKVERKFKTWVRGF